MNKQFYYHVTDAKNAASILKKGIQSNEGEIFLFDRKYFNHPSTGEILAVSDYMARNQLFIMNPVVFSIEIEGIKGRLIPDNVAEHTSRFQYILNQNKIEPKFLNPILIEDHKKLGLKNKKSLLQIK